MLDFEKPMIIDIGGTQVSITVFKIAEHGNIKFGIEAPKNIQINREEVHTQKLQSSKNQRSRRVSTAI